MKEKESKNVDVGKFLLSRLQVAAARPQEVDKYRVHVEEADKIVALLLGLASRLARAEIASINLKKNWNEDEEVSRAQTASSGPTIQIQPVIVLFQANFSSCIFSTLSW